MTDNYYSHLIDEIKSSINNQNYYQAKKMIEDELSMPYIPGEIEDNLLSLKNDLKFYLDSRKNVSEDEILSNLLKKGEIQLKAVDDLIKLNLRNYLSEIQEFFNCKPDKLIQALLIDGLIEQQVDYDFYIFINDDASKFNFKNEVQGIKSASFTKIDDLLKEALIDNDPSTYKLCKELLIQECFIRTPFNIRSEDCEAFASEIAYSVMKMLSINPIYYGFKKQNNKNVYLMCLKVAF